ncbi:macrophage mannose receptor 1-like isoform X1 [Ruditapes philippinarum]|uniref:macrophage mannose receptor 1-like isoform X1 n=2 Tax=Ruditapes philippinarum TaxID=129788 RepID=UPI00295AF6FB|nr:macrophage mannose receptor 1-like isoform X1 [Ruditapes philippinarum]
MLEMRLAATTSLLVMFSFRAFGDFACICNYAVEKSVFSITSEQNSPIGYMYEFDCKQKLDMTPDQPGWYKVAFEHKVGYIRIDEKTQEQLCPGDPPEEDTVTTVAHSVISTTTTLTTTTTIVSTLSPSSAAVPLSTQPLSTSTHTLPSLISQMQTTTESNNPTTETSRQTSTIGSVEATTTKSHNSFSLGNTSMCSDAVRTFTQSNHGVLAQFDNNCYALIKMYQHWPTAEQNCNSAGGHLVDISTRLEQEFLYNFLQTYYRHSIWIGLSDIQNEAHFKWSSGERFYFVNWANHTHFSDSLEDCVVMDMHLHDGRWDDRECMFEAYPYICQFGTAVTGGEISTQMSIVNISSNFTDGNIQLCPRSIKSNSAFHGTVLGQYERGCYELILNSKVSWEHGENICQAKGGHLAHISNADQQAFIESFMRRHNSNHAVWIGLHDTLTEGHFQWTAGTAVQYTNWISGHDNNSPAGHNYEDCVVFVPQQQGYWDDVPCGFEEIFGHDSGESHYAFCQYKIETVVNIVG